MIYGNKYFLSEADKSELVKKFRGQIKNYGKENNEKFVTRLNVNKKDDSLYQKLGNKEKKEFNPPDPSTFINDNTYVAGDLHFGKGNIKKEEKYIDLINQLPSGVNLLLLGDISYVYKPSKDRTKELFKKIKPGIKIYLILGNHDNYELSFYYNELHIKGVYDRIEIPNRKWLFTHQPADGDDTKNYTNFHAHIHERIGYQNQVKHVSNKINCWIGYCDNGIKTIKEWIQFDKKHMPIKLKHI